MSVTILSPYSLLVSWGPPPIEKQNGQIVFYTVSVMSGVSTDFYEATEHQIELEDLHPYFEYDISVAATTVATGPFSSEISVNMPEARKVSPVYCKY